jgi:hypothetical protein
MEHPMPFADVLCKNPACEVEPRSSELGPAGLQDLQISPICHGTATSSNTGFQADVGPLADASSDFLTHLPAVAEHNKRRQEQVQGVKPHGMGNPPPLVLRCRGRTWLDLATAARRLRPSPFKVTCRE